MVLRPKPELNRQMESCSLEPVRSTCSLYVLAANAQAGAGGVIAPFIIEAILARYGRKVTLLSLVCQLSLFRLPSLTALQGIALLVLIGPCFPFLRPRLPVTQNTPSRWSSHDGYFNFLYSRIFWILMSATVVQSLGNFMPFLYLPSASCYHS